MTLGGSIVNISSVHALETTPHVAPYAAAKATLLSLTRSTAIEGRARGIRANAILPGAIDTDALGKSEHQVRRRIHQPGRCRQAGADCRGRRFPGFRRRRLCQRRGAQRGWRPVGTALDVQAVCCGTAKAKSRMDHPHRRRQRARRQGTVPRSGARRQSHCHWFGWRKAREFCIRLDGPDSTARALRRASPDSGGDADQCGEGDHERRDGRHG